MSPSRDLKQYFIEKNGTTCVSVQKCSLAYDYDLIEAINVFKKCFHIASCTIQMTFWIVLL